jgi:hypothetical protein
MSLQTSNLYPSQSFISPTKSSKFQPTHEPPKTALLNLRPPLSFLSNILQQFKTERSFIHPFKLDLTILLAKAKAKGNQRRRKQLEKIHKVRKQ